MGGPASTRTTHDEAPVFSVHQAVVRPEDCRLDLLRKGLARSKGRVIALTDPLAIDAVGHEAQWCAEVVDEPIRSGHSETCACGLDAQIRLMALGGQDYEATTELRLEEIGVTAPIEAIPARAPKFEQCSKRLVACKRPRIASAAAKRICFRAVGYDLTDTAGHGTRGCEESRAARVHRRRASAELVQVGYPIARATGMPSPPPTRPGAEI